MALSQSLPVWRVHFSPYVCNVLDGVTVLPFFDVNSLYFIYWKCPAENGGDSISETRKI